MLSIVVMYLSCIVINSIYYRSIIVYIVYSSDEWYDYPHEEDQRYDAVLLSDHYKPQKTSGNSRRTDQIEKMSDKELVELLKTKGIDSFGTKTEKVERLKRHYGTTC